MPPTKNTATKVLLRETKDWPRWYLLFERQARYLGVHNYALPGTEEILERPVFASMDLRRWNEPRYVDAYKVYLTIIRYQKEEFNETNKNLFKLYEWVCDRVDEKHLLSIPADFDLRETVTVLQAKLGLRQDQERELARREYNNYPLFP